MLRFLVCFCLFLPFGLFAQVDSLVADTTNTFPFVAYWSVGDVYKFGIKKIDIRYKNGEVTKNDTSTYVAIFEVIDSTETEYSIRWGWEDDGMEWAENLPDTLAEKLQKIGDFDVIYTTDELGAFKEIKNMDEITASIQKMTASLTEDMFAAMPDTARLLVQSIMEAYSNPVTIVKTLLAEIQLVHYPYGIEYDRRDTVSYEEFLPNAFGGDPIKSNTILYVDSLDVSNDYVHLKQLMSLDEEDAKNMLSSMYEKMNVANKELDEVIANSVYKIRNDNDFEFYYYPGIPIYIDYFREVKMDIAGDSGARIIQTQITWVE